MAERSAEVFPARKDWDSVGRLLRGHSFTQGDFNWMIKWETPAGCVKHGLCRERETCQHFHLTLMKTPTPARHEQESGHRSTVQFHTGHFESTLKLHVRSWHYDVVHFRWKCVCDGTEEETSRCGAKPCNHIGSEFGSLISWQREAFLKIAKLI